MTVCDVLYAIGRGKMISYIRVVDRHGDKAGELGGEIVGQRMGSPTLNDTQKKLRSSQSLPG